MELPQLFIARYLAEEVLASGEVVPVRTSLDPPVIPLPYELEETAETLVPAAAEMFRDEPKPSAAYRGQLERTGVEKIGDELAAIS